MKHCAELKHALSSGKSGEQLAALAEKINSVCPQALAESDTSPSQFWKSAHR